MKKRYILIMPGEFIARCVDQTYANFPLEVKREIEKGSHKLVWSTKILPLCEYFIILIFGLIMASFKLIWPLLAIVPAYLFVALVDPLVWRRIYGRLAPNGYKISFLVNLDGVYWFIVGWITGWFIL